MVQLFSSQWSRTAVLRSLSLPTSPGGDNKATAPGTPLWACAGFPGGGWTLEILNADSPAAASGWAIPPSPGWQQLRVQEMRDHHPQAGSFVVKPQDPPFINCAPSASPCR